MQADPGAEPRAKSHPRHTLALLYVCTLSTFFFPLTQILIFFPQRAASLGLREAHYFTGVPPLFSPRREEVGQPGRRAAQGCVQAHSGSTGRHTGSTQLPRRKIESASLQQIMGWFIITTLPPRVIAPLQIWPTHLVVNHLTGHAFIKSPH